MAFPTIARYDYRFWPTKEAVTLRFAGTGTGADRSIAVAMREPPIIRSEKLPMGARYIDARMTWRIPAPLLPVGTVIYPGEQVMGNLIFRKPAHGPATWTVDQAELNHMDEVWTLRCLLLLLHPRLSELITIMRPQMDAQGRLPKDATGAEKIIWTVAYADEPAAFILQGGDYDGEFNKQKGQIERWLVVVGRNLTITDRDKIVLNHVGTGTAIPTGEIVLDIDDYQDSDLIDEFPRFQCVRKP